MLHNYFLVLYHITLKAFTHLSKSRGVYSYAFIFLFVFFRSQIFTDISNSIYIEKDAIVYVASTLDYPEFFYEREEKNQVHNKVFKKLNSSKNNSKKEIKNHEVSLKRRIDKVWKNLPLHPVGHLLNHNEIKDSIVQINSYQSKFILFKNTFQNIFNSNLIDTTAESFGILDSYYFETYISFLSRPPPNLSFSITIAIG